MKLSHTLVIVLGIILVSTLGQPLFGDDVVLKWDMDTYTPFAPGVGDDPESPDYVPETPETVADLSGWNNDGEVVVHDGTYSRVATGGPFAASPLYYDLTPAVDGVGVRINGGNDSSLNVEAGSYTVSVWFKDFNTSLDYQEVITRYKSAGSGNSSFYFLIDQTGGAPKLALSHWQSDWPLVYNYVEMPIQGGSSVWHHAVGVFEEGVGSTLWLDGVKSALASDATEATGETFADLTAGGNEGWRGGMPSYPLDGAIDEVQVFDHALTDAQIALLHSTNSAYPDTVPGDANRDLVVNAEDAAILAANWQIEGGMGWSDGDFNGDHNVDDIDATLLAANWSSSASASVPEPSILVVSSGLLLGGLIVCRFRRNMLL